MKENKFQLTDIQVSTRIAVSLMILTAILVGMGVRFYILNENAKYEHRLTNMGNVPNVPNEDYVREHTSKRTLSHKEWDEGGTLRRATVRRWRVATQANKLASCAEILKIASLEGILNSHVMSGIKDKISLKYYAQELVAFIDASVKGVEGIEEHDITEFAAIGFVLMHWGKQ